MQALAAETGGSPVAEAFYVAPEFWVAVAFVVLIALVGKPLWQKISEALDDRSDTIRKQIEEARQLREEAQELLASYQRKQRDAVQEADEIVEHAKQEAERLIERATADLDRSLERREQLAKERIEQAEAKAVREVRNLAMDVALEATRRILVERVTGAKADALIDEVVADLPGKLN